MSTLKDQFSGVFPAVLNPMNNDLSCNYTELVKHINYLLNSGCKGVVLFGTTGEATSFSVREKIKILEIVIENGIDPNLLIIGVGCSSIEDTVELTQKAVDLKCLCVLMHPPYFFKGLKDEGIINFYREVIKNVARPQLKLLLYHIPQLTYAPISLNTIQVLKNEFQEIVIGMKDSHGIVEFTKEVLKTFPNFVVMLGSELKIPELVSLGAVGVVSGLANICPQLICNQLDRGKNLDNVDDRENDVKKYLDLIKNYFFVSALKAIMSFKNGEIWKQVRPPLTSLNDEELNILSEQFKGFSE